MLLVGSAAPACANRAASPAASSTRAVPAAPRPADAQSLYKDGRWLELRAAIASVPASELTPSLELYAGAAAAALLDREQAEQYLRGVLQERAGTEDAVRAFEALIHLYLQLGQYETLGRTLELRAAAFPGRADLQAEQATLTAFTRGPDQTTREIAPARLRHDGDLTLPVSINGRPATFFWDTGAAISVVSEQEARRLGLAAQDDSAAMQDVTGQSVGFRLAVAKTVVVGGGVLQGVSFAIVPDTQEPWSSRPLGRRGLLGIPVLVALRDFRWAADGTVDVSVTREAPGDPNVFFDNDHMEVAAVIEGRTVPLTLDTGAVTTDLDGGFADAFPSLVATGHATSREIRGIGGGQTFEAVTVPEVRIAIGGVPMMLRPAEVIQRPLGPRGTVGNLGFDLLGQARAFRIDFRTMRLSVEAR